MSERKPRCDVALMETLEQRLLLSITTPLVIGGATFGSFIDSSGDRVSVEITGASGSVAFTDTTPAAGVANGEDIATVTITGASKDFAIRFSDDDSSVVGGEDILLGDITSDKPIGGIFTVGGSGGVSDFWLASYTGALAGNGRIQVTGILGNGITGVGLTLPGLPTGAAVNLAGGNMQGDVVINGSLSGAINVLGAWHGMLTVNGGVATTGLITVGGNFTGDAHITGSFLGTTKISGDVSGTWTIDGIVGVKAVLQAGGWDDLTTGKVDGKILANEDSIDLTVNGSITKKGLVAADEDIDVLTVHGNVAAGAKIVSYDSDLFATVDGSANGSWTAGGGDLSMGAGNFLGGNYVGGTVTLTSHAGMSHITAAGGDTTLNAPGTISNSTIGGLGDTLDIHAGAITGSTVGGDAVTVTLTGSMTGVKLAAVSTLAATIGGSLVGSSLAVQGGAELSITNDFTRSSLKAGGSFTVIVGGNMTGGTLVGVTSSDIAVTGNVTGTNMTSANDLETTIGGNLVKSHLVVGGDLTGEVDGQVLNSALEVDGTVGVSMAPPAGNPEDVLLLPQFTDSIPGFIIGEGVVGSTIVSDDMTLEVVTGGVKNSTIGASGFAEIEITGDVAKSTIGGADGLDLTLVGNLLSGQLVGGNIDNLSEQYALDAGISGNVGKGVLIEVGNDDDLFLDVGGSLAGKVSGGTDGEVYVDGDVTTTAAIVFDDDVTLKAFSDFNGKLDGGDLDIDVEGSVGRTAVITAAQNVMDLGADGDTDGFYVGGNYAGKLAVIGNFEPTSLGSDKWFIEGDVLPTGVITAGGDLGPANSLTVAGDFEGKMTIGSMGGVDLYFEGDAGGITIVGAVDANIYVDGALDGLTTGSIFVPTSSLAGDFLNGDFDTVGTLTTGGGWANVQPISFVI